MSQTSPKPCPFCGKPVELTHGRPRGCDTEGCYAYEGTGVDYDLPEDELEAWNRRPETNELVEALKRCIAFIEDDEFTHGRTFGCAVEARAVLAKLSEQ